MRFILALIILCQSFLFSLEESTSYEPLYAGTLLAFYPVNTPPAHISVQPYLYYTHNFADYGHHWTSHTKKAIDLTTLSVFLETGITSYLDISLTLNGTYNRLGNRHTLHYADTQAYLGFQLSRDQKGTAIPDTRIILGENFPTGKYKNLNPAKRGSDISGTGSYQTIFIFVVRKIIYAHKHPFDVNLNLYYLLSAKTDTKNTSLYGGGPHTKGTVKTGDDFVLNLAFDYSLSRKWALGLDIHYIHTNRSPFSGKNPSLAPTGLHSSESYSLAPCLEYSYSETFSLAGGVWFTVAGRNSPRFASGVFNVYYYF